MPRQQRWAYLRLGWYSARNAYQYGVRQRDYSTARLLAQVAVAWFVRAVRP